MSKADLLHFEVTGRTSGLFCHPRAVPPPCGGSEWGHHAADNALGIVAGSTPVTRTKETVLHCIAVFLHSQVAGKTGGLFFYILNIKFWENLVFPVVLC